MAEDGELRGPGDLENLKRRLMLPDWYNTINDKLTENKSHVEGFKDRVKLVVCLGDKDLFYEMFFKGKFDLDAIRNELDEMDKDLRSEMREEGDIEDAFNLRFAPEGEMKAFIDRINQGDYNLSITDPNGLQTVFTSVCDLDEFAEVHWSFLPPWSKYLLCIYNSICSERASDAAATTDSPWVRPPHNRDEAHQQVWRNRVQEVHRLVQN